MNQDAIHPLTVAGTTISCGETASGSSPVVALQDDWLADLSSWDPALGTEMAAFGICSDSDYLEREHLLPHASRETVGIFRHDFHATWDGGTTALSRLRLSPPWVLDRRLDEFWLPPRLRNVLKREKVARFRDLLAFDEETILGLRAFGRVTYGELDEVVLGAVAAGFPRAPDDVLVDSQVPPDGATENFRRGFDQLLPLIPDRQMEVLRRRMGLDGVAETLEEIAVDFGVTRERVRQIQTNGAAKLRVSHWARTLEAKVEACMAAEDRLVTLADLQRNEWFAGCGDLMANIPFLMQVVCLRDIHLIQLDKGSEPVLAGIAQSTWDRLVGPVRAIATGMVGRDIEACRRAVTAIVPPGTPGLALAVWHRLEDKLHFDNAPVPVLMSVGISVEDVTMSVVAALPAPTHQDEIYRLVQERSEGLTGYGGRGPSKHAVVAALRSCAVNFNEGIFGNPGHVRIDPEIRRLVLKLVEATMAGDLMRQWHVEDLVEVVGRQFPALSLDKYRLHHLMHDSKRLTNVWRMSWRHDDSGSDENVDFYTVAIQVLEAAGGPLLAKDIKAHVRLRKGLVKTAQLRVRPPLIRLAHGVWGLAGRDEAWATQ